ncbi:MAG: C1 family peptidase, partial [Candidatus Thermoplasmatota archaeon]|nr:C1 family peptidase [Candidatus Thermoplasmatota archaeon]
MSAVDAMGETISENRVKELRKLFDADPSAKLAQNAVSNNDLLEVALDRDLVQEIDFSFSTKLDKW